jgi:hypothetical protein
MGYDGRNDRRTGGRYRRYTPEVSMDGRPVAASGRAGYGRWRTGSARVGVDRRRNRFERRPVVRGVTRVCILGKPGIEVRYELLSRETARNALTTYELDEPFANTVALDTVSLGAAVSLLNDLDWYLARFARAAFVLESSVSETEWLSRALAARVRNDAIELEDSGVYLAIYGVADGALVEPMYVLRRDPEAGESSREELPEYDLREVEGTLIVRVTEEEFGG